MINNIGIRGILIVALVSAIGISVAKGASQYIFVSGEVLVPGRFAWTNGMTLTNAIERAGGFSVTADREKIELRSGVSTQICSFLKALSTPSRNPALGGGDRVFVPRSRMRDIATDISGRLGLNVELPPPGSRERFVYVEGEVHHQGRQLWTNEMRLSVAIALAGGLTEAADPAGLQIRHQNAGVDIANYDEAINSATKDNDLAPGDRIIVARKQNKERIDSDAAERAKAQ
jgi:protein involved in polysaccharide export with SLBB domain